MKLFEILLVVLTWPGPDPARGQAVPGCARAASAGLLDEEPVLVDYSRAFFPVLAIVLIVRSFIAEPYKIPSSSMMPNLLIGDFILVNKFSYGLRLPISNTKIVPFGEPKRGDVVVFRRRCAGRELHQARDRRAGRHHRSSKATRCPQRQAAEVRQQGHLRRHRARRAGNRCCCCASTCRAAHRTGCWETNPQARASGRCRPAVP
jgi:hypothetical protein